MADRASSEHLLLKPSVLARWRSATSPVTRGELFAGIFLLAFINGIIERVLIDIVRNGLFAALLSTFDISIIVWVAGAIGIAYLLRSPAQPVGASDWAVAACALAAIVVPVGPMSWLATSGLAIYLLRKSPRSDLLRRGAWIILALTVPMFWGRLIFALFSEGILQFDATLVGWLVGTERIGNAVAFPDGSGYLWIAPACSSLANVSLAILCWMTISQVLGRKVSWRDIPWIILACAAVIIINVTRVSLLGLYREHFELIHGPIGSSVASWLILAATVGICLLGVRHDLATRT